MDQNVKTINTRYFDSIKYFLILLIPTFILFPLFIFFKLKFGIVFLGYIGLAFLIFPLILIRQISKRCKKNVTIIFYAEYFLYQTFNIKSGEKEKEKTYLYTDIKSAKIESTASLNSRLKLNFTNNDKFQYLFEDKKTADDELPEYSMSEIIYKSICYYRNKLTPQNRIVLRPSLLASKYGFIASVALTALTLTAIVIHLRFAPKSFITLMPALATYATLIVRRRAGLATYNKMKSI